MKSLAGEGAVGVCIGCLLRALQTAALSVGRCAIALHVHLTTAQPMQGGGCCPTVL